IPCKSGDFARSFSCGRHAPTTVKVALFAQITHFCRRSSHGTVGAHSGSDGTRTRDLRGVTGPHRAVGYSRLRPGITGAGISARSEPAVTGYDRLPPGPARVESVWPE